jgi:hypothetical protein
MTLRSQVKDKYPLTGVVAPVMAVSLPEAVPVIFAEVEVREPSSASNIPCIAESVAHSTGGDEFAWFNRLAIDIPYSFCARACEQGGRRGA